MLISPFRCGEVTMKSPWSLLQAEQPQLSQYYFLQLYCISLLYTVQEPVPLIIRPLRLPTPSLLNLRVWSSVIYLQKAEDIVKHMCKYTWRKAKTSIKLFWKGKAVVFVEEFTSHTAVLTMQTYMCVRGSGHVNTVSSSVPSSPTSVFCLFGFQPPFPAYLPCWASCHRFVHILGASVFPSASSLRTYSTSRIITFFVSFKLVDIGGVLPDHSSASLLQKFRANISLTDSEEEALSHKITGWGGFS